MGRRPPDRSSIAPRIRSLAVPISELSCDPANLRLHGERSIEAIKASLRRFGQQKPVVVDAAGVVIAGNGTLEAARQLGWPEIAAVRSELAGVDRVGYAIADNRTAELSAWDEDALRATMAAMPDAAIADLGWSPEELEELLQGGEEPAVEEDDAPEPLPEAVSRPGDLWILGEHRLLCGDSTSAADVGRVMAGELAALCATDPPYLVDYTGDRPNDSGKDWSGTYKEVEITDADGFFRGLFTNVVSVLAPNAAIYCWHAHRRCGLIQRVWEELGILDHQQVIWVKPSPVFGRVYWHFRHEPCMMGWVQGSQPGHDSDHEHDSVWEIDWEGKSRIVGNEHPTQKPVEIFARPMRKHTRKGAVVFEPFSGSGSQLVAAEQLGRRCRAIELSPVFVDVALRRWQLLTGKAATLEGGGRTWEEIASARGVPTGKDAACPSAPPASATTPAATPPPAPATASATPSSTPRPSSRTRSATSKGRRAPAATEQPGEG
jgi:DNA modification methylase